MYSTVQKPDNTLSFPFKIAIYYMFLIFQERLEFKFTGVQKVIKNCGENVSRNNHLEDPVDTNTAPVR